MEYNTDNKLLLMDLEAGITIPTHSSTSVRILQTIVWGGAVLAIVAKITIAFL